MSRRINIVPKSTLISAALPNHASTYTVIPHQFVIDEVNKALHDAGFLIESEEYKASHECQIASGRIHLKGGEDQEMKMMFAWANSYDKSMRFKCATGGYLPISGSIVLSGNLGTWGRKHTGDADTETITTIKNQIQSAQKYYNILVQDKEAMKNIILTTRTKAEIMGVLYVEHNLLSSEQLNIVCSEIKKPTYKYTADKDSLWILYCHIIFSLQRSHPKSWLDQQRLIHWFLCDMYNITPGYLQSTPIAEPQTEEPDQQEIEFSSEAQV